MSDFLNVEKKLTRYLLYHLCVILPVVALSGCGGAKVLKEPEPVTVRQPLSIASDMSLAATLDWVIFRDGPGSWAKNVDWDEYMIGVQNVGGETLELTSITVVDSLGARMETRERRKELVKGTRKTKRRYKDEGLKVKAGLGGGALVGTGVVVAAGSSGLGAAAMAGGGAAAGAVAVVVLVPTLAIRGAYRGYNNRKVNSQIETRQTLLPVVLEKNEKKNLVLFYPLSPSPQRVEINYVDGGGEHTLMIDTKVALDGLHLRQTEN